MTEVVIASAARTPIGAFNGSLSSVPAHYLGEVAIREALKRAGVEPSEVSEVVLGQVLTRRRRAEPRPSGRRQRRHPGEKTAYGINQLCGSGLRTVALGFQAISDGRCRNRHRRRPGKHEPGAPRMHLRNGIKMGDTQLIDTMLRDGLLDAFQGYHMGTTAENVAEKWQITREQQDQFAAASQNKAEAAMKEGKFKDEIVPVTIKGRKGDVVVDTDEFPRRHGRSAG